MRAADHTFSLAIGLAVLAVGLGATALVGSTWRGPVTDEPIVVGPRDHAVAAASDIEDARRRRARASFLSKFTPAAALRPWRGVLVERSGAADIDAALAEYSGSRDHDQGPPFHFVCDADGVVRATERWTHQRTWRVRDRGHPTEWIIVRILGGAPSERARLLIEGLRALPGCRGELVGQ